MTQREESFYHDIKQIKNEIVELNKHFQEHNKFMEGFGTILLEFLKNSKKGK